MQRLIITGANGSGKSHLAKQIAGLRPDLPLVSYDALRLLQGWNKRHDAEIAARLQSVVAESHWILEGGPSLLGAALPCADAVIWLDPPFAVRAWRLIRRPLLHRGRTRPELPDGNPDEIWPQYRFAAASLRKHAVFRTRIAAALAQQAGPAVWRCRTRAEVEAAILRCRRG